MEQQAKSTKSKHTTKKVLTKTQVVRKNRRGKLKKKNVTKLSISGTNANMESNRRKQA